MLNISGALSTTAFRTVRILRMFRIFRKQNSLKIIFETFIVTLPSLMNVGGLMILFVYIYSVLGMNIFADIQLNDPLSANLNFKTIQGTAITLFMLSTGETFYEFMNAFAREMSITFQCVNNPTY